MQLLLLASCANIVDFSDNNHPRFLGAPEPTTVDDSAADSGVDSGGDTAVDSPADSPADSPDDSPTLDTEVDDTGEPATAWGEGSIESYSLSDWVSWARIGDLTADGLPDIAWSTFPNTGFSRLQTIHVMTQQADHSFVETFTDTPGPDVPLDGNGAIVDVDEDGVNDLVFANSDGFAWYRGDPSGSFGTATQTAGQQNNDLLALDFDADGHVDLVTDDGLGHTVTWVGDGSGAFTTSQSWSPPYSSWNDAKYEAGDFDGDGDLDLVLMDSSGGAGVFWNDGTGTFASSIDPIVDPDPWASYDVAVADLDDDGRDDISLAYLPTTWGVGTWSTVYQFDGSAWTITPTALGADAAANVEPVDLAGDGTWSFAYVDGAYSQATLVTSDSGSIVATTAPLPLPTHVDLTENYNRDKVAWADLDGDGCADLVAFGAAMDRQIVFGSCP